MHARSLSAPAVLAALVSLAGNAHAGIVMGEVNRMDTGAGLIDLDHPMSDPFTDIASIDDPAIGSFLLVEASVPDISSFSSGIEFVSVTGPDAVFSFSNGGWLAPWHLGEYEWAFVASRLAFSSTYGVQVTLLGTVTTTGTGYGFLDVGGNVHVEDMIAFGAGSVNYSTTLGPGAREISWGSLVGNAGGSAQFTGTVTLTLIPGPGSMALFVAAGAVGRGRRRR